VHYFIDKEKGAEVKTLTVDDFNLNRIIFVEPGKLIPQEQLMRTYDWMVSWNLIDAGHEAQDFVNDRVMAAE
jgi:hypothetical protein